LVCEGRLGVPVGRTVRSVREEFETVVRKVSARGGPPAEVTWSGGQFEPAQTSLTHPFVELVQRRVSAVTGHTAPLVGVPYGADLRFYTARGIPTVLYGPGRIEQAHAVDEHVAVDEMVATARILARVAVDFADEPEPAT
jgi:acetylornithine deacetylase